MKTIYVVDGARTPFLKAQKGPGPFAASDLATQAGRALLMRQPFDPSDLDAEIARYERELAEQKAQQTSSIVSNPNVNPNLNSRDPLASAFLTPEELTRLQGSDSYPTRRMPLGPGQP